jgi:flagellar protein FliO/FliZ
MLELTVRLIASLAVVVGLLLLLARFGGRRFRGRSGDLVRIVHRQPLTRTSAVAVVAVGSRLLVLGTTEQHVSILTELDPDELGDLRELGELGEVGEVGEVVSPDGTEVVLDLPRLTVAPAAPRPGAHRAGTPARAPQGALAGSVLSAQTWRQALAVATGKAS